MNARTDIVVEIKPLGGIAGDMFAGACAAMWPDLIGPCLDDLRAAGLPEAVETRFDAVRVNGFAAQAFHVGQDGGMIVPTGDYAQIVARLRVSALERPVLDAALAILTVLGQAEARVHDRPLDHVHFHELADWDSIADVVAAASFVVRSGVTRWTVGPLPLGGGRVQTQHGLITVPAPAVVELLKGYEWIEDGIPGERVTPTGAAIVRHLTDPGGTASGRLIGAGFGAGTRRYDGMANVVQLVAFSGAEGASEPVAELSFDIDDMTGEEMAIAADRLRGMKGVLDLNQTSGIGKKGRAMTLFRVLCRTEVAAEITEACLSETSTLGVRRADLTRRILPRQVAAGMPRVKVADRPGGERSAKAESDDLGDASGLTGRRALARDAERRALEGGDV